MNKKKRVIAAQHERRQRQRRLLAWLIGLFLLVITWMVVLHWMESVSPESVQERFAEHLRKTSERWDNINWIECDPKRGNYELTVGLNSDAFRLKINLLHNPATDISIHDQSVNNPAYATMTLEQNMLKLKSDTQLDAIRERELRTRCTVLYEAFLYAVGKPVESDNPGRRTVIES